MPSIEYGIDKSGQHVKAKSAISKAAYTCPYCYDGIEVRKGAVRDPYFSHNKIINRTPLQRMCPGYTGGNTSDRIIGEVDRLYINNGGLPLYLSKINDNSKKFKIYAYFPVISKESYEILKQHRAKIEIYDKEKMTYNIDNLGYYSLEYMIPWIDIKCNPELNLVDVKKKWLWGIRGIDIEKDVFHSHADGGYRLALGTNIYVGKKYRLLVKMGTIPKVKSINFEKIGDIQFKNDSRYSRFDVYEMLIIVMSEEAKAFIQSKGYRLQAIPDELTSLWPPAVYRGNDLYVNAEEMYFSYENKNSLPLYSVNEYAINDTMSYKEDNIVKVKLLSSNKTLAIGNNDKNIPPEIKFNLVKNNINKIKANIVPEYCFKDYKNKDVVLDNINYGLPLNSKLRFKSNTSSIVKVYRENYVLHSSTQSVENIDYGTVIHCKISGYGSYKYKFIRELKLNNKDNEVDWRKLYSVLITCKGPTVKYHHDVKQFYYRLQNDLNRENNEVFKILDFWIKNNVIPITAINIIKNFKLNGEMKNE